jgi:hypothetical protein
MASDDRASGMNLLEQGTLIEFKVIEEEVIPGTDEGEFGVRIRLHLGMEEDDNNVEWGGLGFMFVLVVLSFVDARPRGMSDAEYEEKDELTVVDFLTGLTYVNGRLRYNGDYTRGRRMKTSITISPDGSALLETVGRGKAAVRWLARLKGKKNMQLIGN